MEKRINRESDIEISGVVTMEKKTIVLVAIVAAIIVIAGVAAAFLMGKGESRKVVYYVNVKPNLMESWLEANESDAYIAWEPFDSAAVVDGTGKILMWTNEIMPHHPCCVVVVAKGFLESDQGANLTLRLVAAHIKATEWILDALAHKSEANYTLLVNMAADFTKRSSAVVTEALDHVEYGYTMNASFRDSLEQFTQMYMDDALITNESLNSRGYDSVADFIDSYVNGTYIDDAGTVGLFATILNPTPIRLGYLVGDLHQMAQVVARNTSAFGGISMFEDYGLDVTPALEGGYAAGGDEMTAFGLGEVDVGYLGAPPAIINHINKNVDTVIVAQANSEGSAIVVSASSDVQSLDDLVGRTVATPSVSSIQHLLLKVALERRGIELVKG